MVSDASDDPPVVAFTTRLLKDVAARYPHATYSVGTELPFFRSVTCDLPDTAQIAFVPDDDPLDLFVGAKSHLELFPGRHTPPAEVMDWISTIVEAVVEGRFEERLSRVGRWITRSKGIVRKPDGSEWPVGTVADMFGKLLPARKTHVRYAPYG